MGLLTEENRRELEHSQNFDDAMLTGMITKPFCIVLDELIQKKNLTTQMIVLNSNQSKSYINKLRNPSEKEVKPSRNVVIDIALAIDATLDETNSLLKAARHQDLYARDIVEAVIIWGMLQKKPGKQIRDILEEKGLDIFFKE